jgi:hypothetical protein
LVYRQFLRAADHRRPDSGLGCEIFFWLDYMTTVGFSALLTKRKAFFSFHYDDIMRVNVVRNAWKITHPDSTDNRSFMTAAYGKAKNLRAMRL